MIPPEDESRELLVHRTVSLLMMYFVILILVGALTSDMIRRWPSIYEFYITLPTASLATDILVPSDAQPIKILADGTVVFDALRLPRSDRDLDSLSSHLKQIAPYFSAGNSLAIQPEPEARHERLVEVLSAVQRAGIRRYHLL
jgi:biopolymer transport protein ExbD